MCLRGTTVRSSSANAPAVDGAAGARAASAVDVSAAFSMLLAILRSISANHPMMGTSARTTAVGFTKVRRETLVYTSMTWRDRLTTLGTMPAYARPEVVELAG